MEIGQTHGATRFDAGLVGHLSPVVDENVLSQSAPQSNKRRRLEDDDDDDDDEAHNGRARARAATVPAMNVRQHNAVQANAEEAPLQQPQADVNDLAGYRRTGGMWYNQQLGGTINVYPSQPLRALLRLSPPQNILRHVPGSGAVGESSGSGMTGSRIAVSETGQGQVLDLQRRNDQLQEEAVAREREVEQLRAQLQEQHAAAVTKETETGRLRAQHEAAAATIGDLHAELLELREVALQQSRATSVDINMDAVTSDLVAEHRLQELESTLEMSVANEARAQAENKALREDKQRLEAQVEAARVSAASRDAEVATTRSQCDKLFESVRQCECMREAAERKAQQAAGQFNALQAELDGLRVGTAPVREIGQACDEQVRPAATPSEQECEVLQRTIDQLREEARLAAVARESEVGELRALLQAQHDGAAAMSGLDDRLRALEVKAAAMFASKAVTAPSSSSSSSSSSQRSASRAGDLGHGYDDFAGGDSSSYSTSSSDEARGPRRS
jgi:hypothetical protein